MDVHFLPAFFLSFPSFSLALLFSTRLLLSSVFCPVVLPFFLSSPLLSLHTFQENFLQERSRISIWGQSCDAILPKIILPTSARNRIIGGWVYIQSREVVKRFAISVEQAISSSVDSRCVA